MINKLTNKPKDALNALEATGRFETFNLTENPFPSNPFVNKASTEAKLNGSIFEIEIREREYSKIKDNFLKVPQSDLNHLRLGFINDTSYIGRGNGKSAFLIFLLKKINENFCFDLSSQKNKCFGIYVVPEGGGKLKTFDKFVDLLFYSILESNIINIALAGIRLEALGKSPHKNLELAKDFDDLIKDLNSTDWYIKNKIDRSYINDHFRHNRYLMNIPSELNLISRGLFNEIVDQAKFREYYESRKKYPDKLEFVFTHLVDLFLAADFNGAYFLVDDFERIPDFQSAIQRKDFSTQLRTILFDGLNRNAKIGFYNFLLALHAGVPRLMEEAWNLSGMGNRVPINPPYDAKNVIAFEKLGERHVILLIKKYLNEYRITKSRKNDDIQPFSEKAIKLIGEISEYNAASILKFSHHIIDQAAKDKKNIIDDLYVKYFRDRSKNFEIETSLENIATTKTIDLKKKARIKHKRK